MIVIRSDALGGLDPAALRPLFNVRDDEMIVTIRIEDGPAPPVPPAAAVQVLAAGVSPGSFVTGSRADATDQRGVEDDGSEILTVRNSLPDDAVREIATPANSRTDDDQHASPGQAAVPDLDDDQPGRALRQATQHPLPEHRGLTFHALAEQARAQRLTLVSPGQGVYTLMHEALGQQRHYATLAQVHDALRYHRY